MKRLPMCVGHTRKAEEATGLILYGSAEKVHTATQINRMVKSSGVKSMIPVRLNDMEKGGWFSSWTPVGPTGD